MIDRDLKCSFQTAPLSVETVGLDAKTAPTTNCQTPNCTNYYVKPTVPLVVEQLVGAPLPTLCSRCLSYCLTDLPANQSKLHQCRWETKERLAHTLACFINAPKHACENVGMVVREDIRHTVFPGRIEQY